jgi:uncharacterized membrane protein YqjE
MSDSQESDPGLSASLRQLMDHTLELVENRVELAVVEFQEERIRLIQAALFLFGMMVCVGMLLLLVTLGVLFLFWDQGRWYAFGGLVALYSLAGFFCWRNLARLFHGHAAFSATLDQFRKDRQWLRRKN